MWVAVNRRTADGSVHHPEQRITRDEALRMWTWNAAYLSFEEEVKGSLEPGKYADFAVLDRDHPRVSGGRAARDAASSKRSLGGRTVYKRE